MIGGLLVYFKTVNNFFYPHCNLVFDSGGMLTPFFILVVLALLFAVLSMVWTNFPLLPVAVILLAVSLLIGKT